MAASPTNASGNVSASTLWTDTVLDEHIKRYPLTYNFKSAVNDYMLREVVSILRKRGELAHLTPFDGWSRHSETADGTGVLLNISEVPIELLGGMLFAGGTDFLFDETPFYERRVKDVRCRFGYSTSEGDTTVIITEDADTTNAKDDEGSPSPRGGADDTVLSASGIMAATASPGSPNKNLPPPEERQDDGGGKFSYDSQRARVYFQLREYEGIGSENNLWIVQTLQLIGKQGPYGRIVYRAHTTSAISVTSALYHSMNPTDEAASRMPLPGEEYLKISNPTLFDFVLRRDPVEMGAAIRVIHNVIEYYRFSFTVIRTVKSLIRSIRVMQRFARKLLANRVSSELRMLREWEAGEKAIQQRLQTHRSLPGDTVDKIVNEALRTRSTTTREWKKQVIRDVWEQRKRDMMNQREMAGQQSSLEAFSHVRFQWMIDPSILIELSQRRLIKRLTDGQDNVFQHPKIQALFVDEVGEREIMRQAMRMAREMEEERLAGRRFPVFGSTAKRFGSGPDDGLPCHRSKFDEEEFEREVSASCSPGDRTGAGKQQSLRDGASSKSPSPGGTLTSRPFTTGLEDDGATELGEGSDDEGGARPGSAGTTATDDQHDTGPMHIRKKDTERLVKADTALAVARRLGLKQGRR